MAQVAAKAFIRAPLDRVYALAKDVEAFPSFMPDVESIRVQQRDGSRTVTEWVGVVQGRRVRWVEDDDWDDALHVCTFRQREGDFTRYEGTWTFTPVSQRPAAAAVAGFAPAPPPPGARRSRAVRSQARQNLGGLPRAVSPR